MTTFVATLEELRAGMAASELTQRLEIVVQRVMATGKAGSVSVTLTIKPAGHGRVFITDSQSVKRPELATESTLFFATETGELSRKNPHQVAMRLDKEDI